MRLRPTPLSVLTRHFFNRLFQNEVFPFAEQMKEKLFVLLAMIATMGWVSTNILFAQYMFVEDAGQSWLEKTFFLFLFQAILILAVVLEWDNLLLDRKDYLNLMTLPVRPRTLFTAKLLSFFLFVGFFTAAVDVLSLFNIAFFLPRWAGDDLNALGRYALAHVLATGAAFVFAFLAFLCLQAVLMLALPPRLYRLASPVIRLAVAVAAIAVIIVGLINPPAIGQIIDLLKSGGSLKPKALLWIPPFWFAGMYEVLIGRGSPLYAEASRIGLAAIAATGAVCFLALALSYRRHIRRSLEIRSGFRPGRALRRIPATLFDRLVLRSPVERGVFHFISRTLRSSARHKFRIAGFAAVASGILIISLGLSRNAVSDPAHTGMNIFAAPLILSIFFLFGLRAAANIPVSPDSNWIFQLTETDERRPYFSALRKAAWFMILLPVFALVFAVSAWMWGAGPALLHALFGLLVSMIVREGLFWRYARIPFACLVVPGKARLQSFWLPYFIAFYAGVSLFAYYERSLFQSPGRFPAALIVGAVLLAALILDQRLYIYKKLIIVYVEEPEPVMVTLQAQ